MIHDGTVPVLGLVLCVVIISRSRGRRFLIVPRDYGMRPVRMEWRGFRKDGRVVVGFFLVIFMRFENVEILIFVFL